MILERIEALQLCVGVVREDQGCALRHRNRVVGAPRLLVRNADQRQRRAALGMPDGFQRRDLRRLVRERVEAVLVTDEDLQRHEHRREAGAEAQRGSRCCIARRGEQPPRRESGDDE